MKKIFLIFIMFVFCLNLVMAGYESQYPPEQSDIYVKATTFSSSPYLTTDPLTSLTGAYGGNQWMSGQYTHTLQRFHIDLGDSKVIDRIYYSNSFSGADSYYTFPGVRHFTFWGSNNSNSFNNLTYDIDTGWMQLEVSESIMIQHSYQDSAQIHYILVNNSISYRYYSFKFVDTYGDVGYMGVRQIELQTYIPECLIDEDCNLCEKCIIEPYNEHCINQTSNEDLKNECAESFTSCFNSYIKQGANGYCDGFGSCSIDNVLLNVTEGNVCYNGNDVNPDITTNCNILINCIENEINANKYYVGYKGDGTDICSNLDWIDTGEDWVTPIYSFINKSSIELLECSYKSYPFPIITLTVPSKVYNPVPLDITSSTNNPIDGMNYSNVLFKINLSHSIPFEEGTERSDIFTITHYDGGTETYGVSETFQLVNGKFNGYWGPITGFPLFTGYEAESTFTIKMNDIAPLGNYQLSIELYDLSENESLAIAIKDFKIEKYMIPIGQVTANLNIENRIMALITILLVFSFAMFAYSKFHKKGMSKIGKSKIGIYLVLFLSFSTKVLANQYEYARENMLLNLITIFLVIGVIYILYQKFFKGS